LRRGRVENGFHQIVVLFYFILFEISPKFHLAKCELPDKPCALKKGS
jgi:hypothetical protein